MEKIINFPKLGIHLENVNTGISFFGIHISYYGILIGAGILLGVLITLYQAKKTGQRTEDYLDYAIVAIVSGIAGARIFYVLFSMGYYKRHLLSIFNFREGGLALYGGIIAALIGVTVIAWLKGANVYKVLDTAVYGLAVGQIIGRWGNFFNRESFGEYTNGLFAMQLPVKAVRISDITDKMREHAVVIDGFSYIQVHPLFLYESLWCLLLLVLLLIYRRRRTFYGQLFLIYILGYGVGRFLFEALRTDKLLTWFFRLPVSQIMALFSVAVSGIMLVYLKKRSRRRRLRRRTFSSGMMK